MYCTLWPRSLGQSNHKWLVLDRAPTRLPGPTVTTGDVPTPVVVAFIVIMPSIDSSSSTCSAARSQVTYLPCRKGARPRVHGLIFQAGAPFTAIMGVANSPGGSSGINLVVVRFSPFPTQLKKTGVNGMHACMHLLCPQEKQKKKAKVPFFLFSTYPLEGSKSQTRCLRNSYSTRWAAHPLDLS